jgi:hypothetical protein
MRLLVHVTVVLEVPVVKMAVKSVWRDFALRVSLENRDFRAKEMDNCCLIGLVEKSANVVAGEVLGQLVWIVKV